MKWVPSGSWSVSCYYLVCCTVYKRESVFDILSFCLNLLRLKDNWKWFSSTPRVILCSILRKDSLMVSLCNIHVSKNTDFDSSNTVMSYMRFLLIQHITFRVTANTGSKNRCAKKKKYIFFFLLHRIISSVLLYFFFLPVEAKTLCQGICLVETSFCTPCHPWYTTHPLPLI